MNSNFIPQYKPVFNVPTLNTEFVNYFQRDGYMTEYMETRKFEQQIAEFLGVKHCITVNNGTISLSLALMACGIKPGDKVLVPSLTMIATANAVKFIGAVPYFVDVDPKTLCMDIEQAYALLEEDSIRGVIYVSLNGRRRIANELDLLIKECKKRNKAFIEDAAQAFGSQDSKGIMIGNSEHISSFSFSMPKIITTGQGGCLTTNNDDLAQTLKHLKDFGRTTGGNDVHDFFGCNFKFTDLQALVGLEQMMTIKDKVTKKKWMYHLYHSQLKELVEFVPTNIKTTTPWFIDIYTDKRNALMKFLQSKDIGTRAVYAPLYTQKCYNVGEYRLDIKHPVTERYSYRGLWLPSSLSLSEIDIMHICNKIKEFFKYTNNQQEELS